MQVCHVQAVASQGGAGTGARLLSRRCVVLFGVAAALFAACLPARAEEPIRETVVDAAWDAVFNRTEGWIGGDAIYSTPLPRGDVLWLFADTIIGKVRDGRRADLQMVNNTLARHALPQAGAAPDPQSVKFLWGSPSDAEKAKAWIVPEPVPGDAAPSKEWFWVGDALVAPSAQGRDRLIVFLWRIASTSGEVFGFRAVGNALAIIDDPAADWTTWRPRQVVVTHAVPVSSADVGRKPEVTWGSKMLLIDEPAGEPQILIYGYRQPTKSPTQLELVLARAPAAAIEEMEQWQFRTVDAWSSSLDDAASQADGLTTEFSVTRIGTKEAPRWVLIHSEPALGERIFARTARSPYGPWSARKEVYHVPGIDKEKKHFTYAAKAHPELSRPDELLVSYVVNSFDFGEGLTNAGIYRPRFIRMPASILPEPPRIAE